MAGQITVDDLIELEAYAESLRNKAQQLREKMQKEEAKRKRKTISPQRMAEIDAHLLKTQKRARARIEEKQRDLK